MKRFVTVEAGAGVGCWTLKRFVAVDSGNTALEAWVAGIRVSRRKFIQKWTLRLEIAAYL